MLLRIFQAGITSIVCLLYCLLVYRHHCWVLLEDQTNFTPSNLPVQSTISWSQIFPAANLSAIPTEWATPMDFLKDYGRFTSQQWIEALQDGELFGKDLPSRVMKRLTTRERNQTLSYLLQKHTNIKGNKLAIGFKPSKLYQLLAIDICAVLKDTHCWFMGDSTVQRLARRSGLHHFGCRQVSTTTHETTVRTSRGPNLYYHQRAYRDEFQDLDYGHKREQKHKLILANFDGLHSLSLMPVRNFSMMHNGQTLFHGFDDFVRYQLRKIEQVDNAHLIVVNTNSIAHHRYEGTYAHAVHKYQANNTHYAQVCSETTGFNTGDCLHSVFTDHGARWINQRLSKHTFPSTSKFIDAYYLTHGRGYLSGMGDGRHYPPLMPLKVVNALGLYILMRIETYLRGNEALVC